MTKKKVNRKLRRW